MRTLATGLLALLFAGCATPTLPETASVQAQGPDGTVITCATGRTLVTTVTVVSVSSPGALRNNVLSVGGGDITVGGDCAVRAKTASP